jgi:predicted RNase H-like HicB family nuclease
MKLFSKRRKEMLGSFIKCQSGRFLAFYEHRTDIIANGNNEKEALKNLKDMYQSVTAFEKLDDEGKKLNLSEKYEVRHFSHKVSFDN